MRVQLVVFDLAGTTVNDPGAVNGCFRAALEAAGVRAAAAAVNAVMGLPKPEAIRRLVEGSPQAEKVDAIHADFVERMNRFYATDPAVCEIKGTTAVFKRLRAAGVKVAANSGFSRSVLRVLLGRLGWERAGLIDGSVASDEVPRGRPHPDMIFHLMKLLGVTESAAVAKVGDTPADLAEGTAAGCGLVVGVTEGTHTRDQLACHPHTHLIANVNELPDLLDL
jgi:phosphonatase-like hydrolase